MITRLLYAMVMVGFFTVSIQAYEGVLNFQVMMPPVSLFEKSHQAIVDVWQYALSLPAQKPELYAVLLVPMMRQLLALHGTIKSYVQEQGAENLSEDTLYLYELLQRLIGCLEEKKSEVLYGAIVLCQECQEVLSTIMHSAT